VAKWTMTNAIAVSRKYHVVSSPLVVSQGAPGQDAFLDRSPSCIEPSGCPLRCPTSRYVASGAFMTGRGQATVGLGDSFASTTSVRLTRSYSAQTVSSQ
jgi:hypothetical protein